MKLKVLVVDDERTIREGLESYVPWDELGYELVGCAKNAREALSFFDAGSIDLLITDIEMPGQSGLALVEQLSETKKIPAVIIISGYNHFDYAQHAIQLGVICDYVLKPIQMRSFREVLQKTHDFILQKRARVDFPVVGPDEFERILEGGSLKHYNLFSLMERSLLDGDYAEASAVLQAAVQELMGTNPPRYILQRYFSGFLLSLESFLQHQGMTAGEIFQRKDPVEQIMQLTDEDTMIDYVQEITRAVCAAVQKNISEQDALMAQAVELIRAHFLDESFSLAWLADRLMISPNYLSTRFKRVTGCSFTRYVNTLRIERAKLLLQDARYKIFEISDMVGFEDTRYFTRIFKEHTGLTPADYRNRTKGKS